MVSYYVKWDKTSWTYSNKLKDTYEHTNLRMNWNLYLTNLTVSHYCGNLANLSFIKTQIAQLAPRLIKNKAAQFNLSTWVCEKNILTLVLLGCGMGVECVHLFKEKNSQPTILTVLSMQKKFSFKFTFSIVSTNKNRDKGKKHPFRSKV